MNIMVFDVPADSGGALTILKNFYDEVKSFEDKSINWIFVISTPYLEETENIKVISMPWIKKNWGFRLYFDNFIAPGLVKKYNADKILSLQNFIIKKVDIKQILYLHQPLPFVDYKFPLRENIIIWIYQNILSKDIFYSVEKSDKVIVQTLWIKKMCMEKLNINNNKIYVIPPKINYNIKKYFELRSIENVTFFYPANAFPYKNHKVIVEACEKLKSDNILNFKVIFTLQGNENKNIFKLYKEIKEKRLPIIFSGNLPQQKVYDLYTKTILLFPSYLETFGLPLLEARMHRGIVLASDCPFSHEILSEYKNAYFFNPFNSDELSVVMKKIIDKKIEYCNTDSIELSKGSNIPNIIDLVVN